MPQNQIDPAKIELVIQTLKDLNDAWARFSIAANNVSEQLSKIKNNEPSLFEFDDPIIQPERHIS